MKIEKMLIALNDMADRYKGDSRIDSECLQRGVAEGQAALEMLRRGTRPTHLVAYWLTARACSYYFESGLFALG